MYNGYSIAAALLTVGTLLLGCSPAETADPPVSETPGPVEARDYQDETFDLAGAAQLELKNINGSITLKTGKPGQVSISATRVGTGNDAGEAKNRLASLAASIRNQGNSISVVAGASSNSGKFSWSGKYVDVTIVAQENTSFKLTDGGGTIKIAGITGGVDIAGGRATVNLSNIKGGVTVAMKGGSVLIDGASGPTRIDAQDAPVSVVRLSSPSLAVTSTADISIKDTQVDGEASVMAISGKVSLLRLKAGDITADAGAGSLDIVETTADHAITVQARDGRVYASRVNSGLLKVTTTGGEIAMLEIQGGVELATTGGKIGLSRATPSSLEVKGGAGDVSMDGQFAEPVEASIATKAGHISITVPRETSLALEAATRSGKVTIDPKFGLVAATGSPAGQVKGTLGAGLVHLALSSESGNISVQTGQR